MAETVHRPLRSRMLCEVLFDLYLGAEAFSEQGRRSVIASFPELLAMQNATGDHRTVAEPWGDARRCRRRLTGFVAFRIQ